MDNIKGKVIVSERSGVKVHTYIAPVESFSVTTHCLELKDQLVIFDSQFLAPCAAEARQVFESIGKPIGKVIITHGHPDHWFGLSRFFDLQIHALPSVIDFIRTIGAMLRAQYHQNLGPAVDENHIVPQHTLQPGTETISGIRFLHKELSGAEAGTQLLSILPDHGIVVGQDLFYHGIHLYLETLEFDSWLAALDALASEYGDALVLCGHGEPGRLAVIAEKNMAYLRCARDLHAQKLAHAEFKQRLFDAFPQLSGRDIVDLWMRLAFKS